VVVGTGVVVGVTVPVAVGLNVAVGVMVLVAVGASVDVAVGVMVLVTVGVAVGVIVGVTVGVAVGAGVLVGVGVSVAVGVGVGVLAGWAMVGAGTGCALRPLAWLGAGQSMLLVANAINIIRSNQPPASWCTIPFLVHDYPWSMHRKLAADSQLGR
jgi:hypothetical protein